MIKQEQKRSQGQVRHTLHQHQRSGRAGRVRGERQQEDRRDTEADQQEFGYGWI